MKIKLDVGAELDLLSPGEYKDGLESLNRTWFEEMGRGLKHIRFMTHATVTAGAFAVGAPLQPDGQLLGPREGFVWSVDRITVSGLATGDTVRLWRNGNQLHQLIDTLTPNPNANGVVGGLWGAFGAGLAGAVAIPLTYAYVTGFDVTTAIPAAPPIPSVVTAAIGASFYTYDFIQTANGGLLQVRYPAPGISIGPAGPSTVAIGVAAGGAAGNINVYGSGMRGISATYRAPNHGTILHPGETLVVTGGGLTDVGPVYVTGDIIEAPGPMIWKLING